MQDSIIRVYIVKSSNKELRQAESYLKNRGWQVASSSTLKEALLFIIKNKPDFVLITSDHSQKKIFSLPQLIKQAFNIPVIGYSENLTQASFKRLDSMNTLFKMNQSPSGPAIERMILNIRKQLQNTASIDTLNENAAWIQQDAQKALSQFMKFDADITETGGAYVFNQEDNSKEFEVNQTAQSLQLRSTESKEISNHLGYGQESLVAKGVETVLQMTTSAKAPITEDVQMATKATCIIIDSPVFTGYLIAVFGKDREMDQDFMRELKFELFHYLKENGHHVQESELLDLKINTIAFNSWAMSQADFLKKSIRDGKELALAFFPIEKNKITTKFETSKNISKLKMKIEDLKPDVPLEFDLYLHMESNDRYLLYTPQNFPIYGSQLERLKGQGISHLHIRKEQVSLVKKYQVQNYLNQKISAYNYQLRMQASA